MSDRIIDKSGNGTYERVAFDLMKEVLSKSPSIAAEEAEEKILNLYIKCHKAVYSRQYAPS